MSGAWRLEPGDCPLCEAPVHQAQRLGRRGGAAHGARCGVETTIHRCRSCHLVYQHPVLRPEGNPYEDHPPDDYFNAHSAIAKVESGQAIALQASGLLGRTGRLLEVGCGRGDLLRGAANLGWECAGIEMTPSYAEHARARYGLRIETGDVGASRLLSEEWDVIVMAAVLEHLYDPLGTLRRVAAALRPGGVVYIDVPNECSLYTRVGNSYQRLRGRDWAVNLSPTFPPFHVVGFCPTSLRQACDAVGLEVRSLTGYAMEGCMDLRTGGVVAWVERLAARFVLRVGHAMGQSAGLTCWAQRRSR